MTNLSDNVSTTTKVWIGHLGSELCVLILQALEEIQSWKRCADGKSVASLSIGITGMHV